MLRVKQCRASVPNCAWSTVQYSNILTVLVLVTGGPLVIKAFICSGRPNQGLDKLTVMLIRCCDVSLLKTLPIYLLNTMAPTLRPRTLRSCYAIKVSRTDSAVSSSEFDSPNDLMSEEVVSSDSDFLEHSFSSNDEAGSRHRPRSTTKAMTLIRRTLPTETTARVTYGNIQSEIQEFDDQCREEFDPEAFHDGNVHPVEHYRASMRDMDTDIFKRKEYAKSTVVAIDAVMVQWKE